MAKYYGSSDSTAKVIVTLAFYGIMGLYLLVQCGAKIKGNRDNIDTEKRFNFIIDYAADGTSIVKVNRYTDYSGQTIEFFTQDGLKVVTGLSNAELMFATSYEEAYKRALELTNGDASKITSYDLNQGLSTEVTGEKTWNKKWVNLNYTYDYEIVETPNGVVITNIPTWRDWDDDEKVQFVDEHGNVYLSTYLDHKLIDSREATDEAVYQYALSLAGSPDRLSGDVDVENQTVRRLVPRSNYTENDD